MLINNITINNFQSYYKEQTINFSKGLNLIIGKGGKGKSKFFNAFNWVLFGRLYLTDIGWCVLRDNFWFTTPKGQKGMNGYKFVNERALDKSQDGNVIVSVSIEIEDDYCVLYTIERSANAIYENGYWTVKSPSIKVSYDSPTGTKVCHEADAEDIIDNLFNKDIRNYIWFQGETLSSLIDFRNRDTLKSAVKHISYFPYYEKLSAIISKSKDIIVRKENTAIKAANKQNSDLKSLITNIEKINMNIDREEINKENIEQEINTINISLAEDENKLGGLASYAKVVSDYAQVETEFSRLTNEITNLDNYQRDKLPKLWVLRGVDDLIKDAKEIIQSYMAEEYSVPEKKYLDNPSRAKLEDIIKDKRCFVCGTAVTEGSEALHYIQERMRLQDEYLKELDEYTSNMQFIKQFNMLIGKIQDYPDALLISLYSIDKQWKNSDDEIQKLMTTRKRVNEKKRVLEEKIEEIRKKTGADPKVHAGNVDYLSSNVRASRSNLERKRKNLDVLNQSIAKLKSELKSLEKDYEKLSKSDKTIERVPETEWKNISIFLEDICKRVQERARKELLKKIEVRANEFYKKFTEHDSGYKGNVKINEDYSIEFDEGLNTSNDDRKKISIINALLSLNQEAIGTYYPFISDAPTSNFDPETTFKYLMGIKDMFNQTIIMTKDVEIDSDNYTELLKANNVEKVYVLESELYTSESTNINNPKLSEVSTKVYLKK